MTPRIILHVGLPKTGTSALQQWCLTTFHPDSNHNVEYSFADNENELMPKHQFLVNDLMTGNFDKTQALLTKLSKKKVSILSTEGLTNHLYDFPDSSLNNFRKLFSPYHIDIFIVFRNTEKWIKSYYKQCVINPPMAHFNYATPLPLREFSKLERIQKLTMRHSVKTDVVNFFGAQNVVSADYDEGWDSTFINELNLDEKITFDYPSVNTSTSDDLTEFIRQINSFNFNQNIREIWLGLLQYTFKTNSTLLKFYEKNTVTRNITNQINLKSLERLEQQGDLDDEKITQIKEKLFIAYTTLNKVT